MRPVTAAFVIVGGAVGVGVCFYFLLPYLQRALSSSPASTPVTDEGHAVTATANARSTPTRSTSSGLQPSTTIIGDDLPPVSGSGSDTSPPVTVLSSSSNTPLDPGDPTGLAPVGDPLQ